MKTKYFGIAAIVCGIVMSMTSCGNSDMPVNKKQTVTISVEQSKAVRFLAHILDLICTVSIYFPTEIYYRIITIVLDI